MTGAATAHRPTLRVAERGRRRAARCSTRRSPRPTRPGAGGRPAGADRPSYCPAGPDPGRAAAHGLFPDVVEVLAAGLGPAEAIVEGEVVVVDPSAGELRPFGEVMFRRRKHGIAEAVRDVSVGLFCFELL